MVVANEKPTGTNYTATAALLILAFFFIPAVLIVSRPFGDVLSFGGDRVQRNLRRAGQDQLDEIFAALDFLNRRSGNA